MDNSNNAYCQDIFHMPKGNVATKASYYLGILGSIVFSLVGYYLLGKKFREEGDEKKKNFLGLILLVSAVSFVIFVPIAKMMSTGYYVILFIVPFIFCGLIFDVLEFRCGTFGKRLAFLFLFILMAFSLQRDNSEIEKNIAGLNNNAKGSTLGEVKAMPRYIIEKTSGHSFVYFSGKTELANRFWKPIDYFTEKEGVRIEVLSRINSGTELAPEVPLFYILDKKESLKYGIGQRLKNREIIDVEHFSNQNIFLLKN